MKINQTPLIQEMNLSKELKWKSPLGINVLKEKHKHSI